MVNEVSHNRIQSHIRARAIDLATETALHDCFEFSAFAEHIATSTIQVIQQTDTRSLCYPCVYAQTNGWSNQYG